jgi:hypothetical protein
MKEDMFKQGQAVMVRKNLKEGVYDSFGKKTESFTYGEGYGFLSQMETYCGKVTTINRKFDSLSNSIKDCYYLNNFGGYYWHESWLLPVGGEKEEVE